MKICDFRKKNQIWYFLPNQKKCRNCRKNKTIQKSNFATVWKKNIIAYFNMYQVVTRWFCYGILTSHLIFAHNLRIPLLSIFSLFLIGFYSKNLWWIWMGQAMFFMYNLLLPNDTQRIGTLFPTFPMFWKNTKM